MKKYIFGEKIRYISNLTQTVDYLKNALTQVHKVISSGGKLLVVSTKKQASEQVSELAKETGHYLLTIDGLAICSQTGILSKTLSKD